MGKSVWLTHRLVFLKKSILQRLAPSRLIGVNMVCRSCCYAHVAGFFGLWSGYWVELLRLLSTDVLNFVLKGIFCRLFQRNFVASALSSMGELQLVLTNRPCDNSYRASNRSCTNQGCY